MATQDSEQVWQSLFDQHRTIVTLLDAHASLLVEMRKYCVDSSQTLDLIQSRLFTTENIIATLKQSSESLQETTNREEVISKAKRSPMPSAPLPSTLHTPSEPLFDHSGLFRVDTNPTPIEQLFRETSIRGGTLNSNFKRNIVDEELHVDNNDGNKSRRKKARPSDQDHGLDPDDSFVREVDAKVRAKEERKKTRQEKKRKRQSDSSINAVNKGPKNKKQKQRHESKAPVSKPSAARQNQGGKRSNTDSNPDGRQNGHPNKKRKKTKG